MGCGSGKDIKASAGMAIQSTMVPTGMLEFDQIFLVLAQKLQEAEKVRLGVVPNHFNIIRIVKADHLAEPTIIDAYKLWLMGVSCCNKGQLKACKFEFNEENNTFKAQLGTCGEYKFHWFSIYLNGLIEQVSVAQKLYPQLKKTILEHFARIQGMKTDIQKYISIFPTMTDKMTVIGKLGINVAQIGLAIKICEEVEKNLVNYAKEIKVLQETHSELEKQADVQGLKIYERYGCNEVTLPDSNKLQLRMNYKMTELVHFYYDGTTRRTAEQQNAATLIKTERAQNRPFRTTDFKPDDLPYKGNGLPYRIRWIGCAAIDNDMQFLSMFLQEIDTQYSKVTLKRNLIRFRLNTYTLVDDKMIEAFKVFMWAYIKAMPQQKAFDELTYQQILSAKGAKEDIEEVRLWMLEYCKYSVPSRAAYIQETYQDSLEKMKLLKNWAKGHFLKLPEFQSIKLEHQYNMMSNISKNINTLIEYQKLLPKFFIEVKNLLEESSKVWMEGSAIMIEAVKENGNCKDLELSKIVANVHKGAQNSDDVLKDLKVAYQKLYDENKVKK